MRLGKTIDQIAEIMRLSRSAVEFRRGNMRRKLGLKRGDQQLGAALSTLLAGRSIKPSDDARGPSEGEGAHTLPGAGPSAPEAEEERRAAKLRSRR